MFFVAYVREALNIDEPHALMTLIMASLEAALRAGIVPPELAGVRAALVRDYAIHFHTVENWASQGELLFANPTAPV